MGLGKAKRHADIACTGATGVLAWRIMPMLRGVAAVGIGLVAGRMLPVSMTVARWQRGIDRTRRVRMHRHSRGGAADAVQKQRQDEQAVEEDA